LILDAFQKLPYILGDLLRHLGFDNDVHIAGFAPALTSLSLDPELGSRFGSHRNCKSQVLGVDRLHIEFGPEDQVEDRYFHSFYNIERWLFRFCFLGMGKIFARRGPSFLSRPHTAEKIAKVEFEVLRTPSSSPAELGEYIFISTEPLSSPGRTAESCSGGSEGIVLLAFLRIPEHLVSGIYFLEFFFSLLVPFVVVRMVLHRKLAIGLLYLISRRSFCDSEHGIRIFLGHKKWKLL